MQLQADRFTGAWEAARQSGARHPLAKGKRKRPMTRSYLPYDHQQLMLLPHAMQNWLPEDHLA